MEVEEPPAEAKPEAMEIEQEEAPKISIIAQKLEEIVSDKSEERIQALGLLLEECKAYEGEALIPHLSAVEKMSFELADLLAENQVDELPRFMETLEAVFSTVSNAKSAKVVTGVIRRLSREGVAWGVEVPIDLCLTSIARCEEMNRKFLRHRVEQNLAELYYRTRQLALALKTSASLVHEIKRLDDKLLLVELHLLESRIQHALRNIPKAKAALTASRASATSVYVNPDLQAELDMQGGVIATEEDDYKVGYSYFFEAFEGCRVQKDMVRAKKALIYMLLSKIMGRKFRDLNSVVSSKAVLEFAGPEVERMHAISKACEKRSIKDLEEVVAAYPADDDTLLQAKLVELQSTLEEENLLKLVEPYSKVQIAHIAKLIDLPVDHVTKKLSHMILDQKLHGILDQGAGAVIMYEKEDEDRTFEYALDTLEALEDVIDQLMLRVQRPIG